MKVFLNGIWLMCAVISLQWVTQDRGSVEVIVENVSPLKGTLRAALYDSKEKFMKKHVQVSEVKVTSLNMRLTFNDLPSGEYAFSIFHDINDNGELDTNLLGIPKEPWGFSNNARGTFGPPDFEAASFRVSEKVVLQVKLNR
ncbi:MAG: DUF2141 domain-containing protein [Cyclobacteriaceae bacterium]|nr:DUF2141 domain-containing protein [Cyclobacteriaceae bacterium]MDW8331232.1 DUF2141 domain-containing protein [Cyclobacteriaceae bacterium]